MRVSCWAGWAACWARFGAVSPSDSCSSSPRWCCRSNCRTPRSSWSFCSSSSCARKGFSAAMSSASDHDRPPLARTLAQIVVAIAAYVALTWLVEDRYYQLIFTIILIWAAVGVAFNLFSGYSGLLSFGHAAFFGLGAYTVALLLVKWGISPWIGIVVAAGVGAIAGIVIGYPTFRLRGHYFALAMLAYPLVLLYLFQWMGLQEVSLPMAREAPAAYMQFANTRIYILISAVLLAIALGINLYVARSRFGLSLLAIKQNEPAAMAAGINPLEWKLKAIMLSASLTAVAGG